MKTIKPKAIKFPVICAILIFLYGCSSKPHKAGYWIDGKIDGSISSDFHEQNKQFFDYVKTNYQLKLKGILANEIINDPHKMVRDIDHIRNALNKNDYELFKEIYVVNKWKSVDTVKFADGKSNVMMTYPGIAREMYFAMFLPKNSDNKRMITITYANLSYGWRITRLEIAPYSINGKTAPQLYQMAHDAEANKYYEDAVTTAGMGIYCAKPNEEWQYDDAGAMLSYSDTLEAAEKKYVKFPLKVSAAGSPISIFKVYDQRNDDGIFPAVCYTTKINVKNAAAVQQENLKIQKIIGTVIPGLDKNKKFLLYSAYNKEPVDAYQEHFDMTEKF